MVAVAQFIPQDPKEQESVLAVLREHPELQDFILRASEKAEEIFPEVRITLDTVRYDEWDPPCQHDAPHRPTVVGFWSGL